MASSFTPSRSSRTRADASCAIFWNCNGVQVRHLMVFPALSEKLGRREDVTTDEAANAMATIMRGEATSAQIAGLLIGLAMKGEHPSELVGFARTMRAEAVALPTTDIV